MMETISKHKGKIIAGSIVGGGLIALLCLTNKNKLSNFATIAEGKLKRAKQRQATKWRDTKERFPDYVKGVRADIARSTPQELERREMRSQPTRLRTYSVDEDFITDY